MKGLGRVALVVRRELLEGLRQRWLLVNLAAVLAIVGGGALWLLGFADRVLASRTGQEDLAYWMSVLGVPMDDPAHALAGTVVVVLEALTFNQLMSMTAVMAGHAGLHDRQCGTLPFLLLAPLRRFELLVGKVLGALVIPLGVYLLVGGATSVAASTYASTSASAGYLPPSGGWVGAFLLDAPAWSILTGTICVLVSAVSRDVRTAQQAAWAVVFFATFALTPAMVGLMPAGLGVHVALAGVALVLSVVALAAGAAVIGRDLRR